MTVRSGGTVTLDGDGKGYGVTVLNKSKIHSCTPNTMRPSEQNLTAPARIATAGGHYVDLRRARGRKHLSPTLTGIGSGDAMHPCAVRPR